MSEARDMTFLQEPKYGDMRSKWEEQKSTHHKLCHIQKGWDMSCDCKKIEEVEQNFFSELSKDVEKTEIKSVIETILHLIPVVEQMWGYEAGLVGLEFALKPHMSGNILLRSEVKDVLIEYMRVELLKEIEGNKVNG